MNGQHGQHCYDVDATLVCGWPEYHARKGSYDAAALCAAEYTPTDQGDPDEDAPALSPAVDDDPGLAARWAQVGAAWAARS